MLKLCIQIAMITLIYINRVKCKSILMHASDVVAFPPLIDWEGMHEGDPLEDKLFMTPRNHTLACQ